jgi:hypothetical protein
MKVKGTSLGLTLTDGEVEIFVPLSEATTAISDMLTARKVGYSQKRAAVAPAKKAAAAKRVAKLEAALAAAKKAAA